MPTILICIKKFKWHKNKYKFTQIYFPHKNQTNLQKKQNNLNKSEGKYT